jgi:hypothetical protein
MGSAVATARRRDPHAGVPGRRRIGRIDRIGLATVRRAEYGACMQVAGRPSWRFEENDGGDLHQALFIRDAAGLGLSAAPDIPPPLLMALDRPPRGAGRAAAAADQWVAWWRRLVEFQADEVQPPHRRAPAEDMHGWLRAKAERHAAVFDPPDFASLASTPELQAVATETFPDAQRLPRHEPRIPPGAFDYQVVRAAAEAAGHEFGVSPDEIDGAVQVLDVQGAWSFLAGPGYALCSSAVAADPQAAAQLLRAVFASRLR